MKRIALILGFILIVLTESFGQCGGGTPIYFVDLTSDPSGSWESPLIIRNDTCCGAEDKCVQFIISLHPNAESLTFEITSGSLPSGSLFYEIDCGGAIPIDSIVCISGPGPHSLTFCKPGLNANAFEIRSVPSPNLGVDVIVAEGCVDTIKSEGFESSSTFWRSIYPGAIGDYNSYLDCTIGCDMAVVTPQVSYPPYIDYQVCGFALSNCDTIGVCDTIRVFFSDSLDVNIFPETPMVCYGNSTTTISANVNGGEEPFSYIWSTGETSQSIDVGPGSYSVTVSDDGNCYTVIDNIIVGQFYDFITADAGIDQLLCNQSPEVQLNGNITGVSTAYWNGGQGFFSNDSSQLNTIYYPSASEISNGFAELWLLTTNTFNCQADSDMIHIDLVGFMGDIDVLFDSTSCFNADDAMISIDISNGYQDYTYLWDDPSNSTQSSLIDLSPGLYTVLISDSLSCDTSLSFVVNEPDMLSVDSLMIMDLLCFNDSSGEAKVFISGGTAPYIYNWGVNAGFQNTSTATMLAAGSYLPTIYDMNGCSIDTTISIYEPSALILSLESNSDVLCYGENNGSASVTGLGGIPAYTFTWNIDGNTFIGDSFDDLSAGTYLIELSDANLCADTIYVLIDEPTVLTSETIVLQNVPCFDGDNGSGEVIASGGIAPYTYLWDSLASFQTTSIANNLENGSYIVLVSDSNNCTSEAELIISEPDSSLNLDLSTIDVSCYGLNNGSASILASGGTAPYSYVWDQNIAGQNTSSADSILPGSYLVWISDANNCIASEIFTINEPEQLVYQLESTDVTCFGGNNGNATIILEGGVGPYFYEWCEEADNQSTAIASNLSAGQYDFQISDQNQCEDSGLVYITEPTQVVIEATEDTTVCPNSLVNVSAQASGGTGPYSYFWIDFGQGQDQSLIAEDDVILQVMAIDSLGCPSEYDAVQLNVINFINNGLNVSNSGDICQGDETSVVAEFIGDDQAYSYYWNNDLGSNFGPIEVSPNESTTYIFTIIDECGTALIDSTIVIVRQNPEVSIESTINEGCAPLEVSFAALSDQSNLNYVWMLGNGNVSIEDSPSSIYEEAGNYTVELSVFNNFGCTNDSAINSTINVYPVPLADFTASTYETDITEPTIQFSNTSSDEAVFFTWDFDDEMTSMDENPEHTYLNAGEYFVNLETESIYGCTSAITKRILINPNHDVIVPNAFTPNLNSSSGGFYDPKDLSNDVFYPFAEFIIDYHLQVFNRWGEIIFASDDISIGWDGYYLGKIAPAGSYAYKIDLTFYDGYSVKKNGQIKLIK